MQQKAPVGLEDFTSTLSELASVSDSFSSKESSFIAQLEAPVDQAPHSLGYRRPTVSFDLDGTLANTVQSLLDIASELHPEVIYGWEDVRVSLPNMVDLIGAARKRALEIPHFWENIEAFDSEEMSMIADQIEAGRYAAVFVSTRQDLQTPGDCGDARILSAAWLNKNGVHGWAASKFTAKDKVADLIAREVQYHVDDDPEVVQPLRTVGIEAFLVTRPWNEHVHCAWRVDSVSQFLEIVAPPIFTEDAQIDDLERMMLLQ